MATPCSLWVVSRQRPLPHRASHICPSHSLLVSSADLVVLHRALGCVCARNVTSHTHPCLNHSFLQVPHAHFTASTGVVLLISVVRTMIGMLLCCEASIANQMIRRIGILLADVAEGEEEMRRSKLLYLSCSGVCCWPWATGVVLASIVGGVSMVESLVLDELFARLLVLLDDELKIALCVAMDWVMVWLGLAINAVDR